MVEEDTLRTSREGVYAGGDVVTGAATVILAMAAGKRPPPLSTRISVRPETQYIVGKRLLSGGKTPSVRSRLIGLTRRKWKEIPPRY